MVTKIKNEFPEKSKNWTEKTVYCRDCKHCKKRIKGQQTIMKCLEFMELVLNDPLNCESFEEKK